MATKLKILETESLVLFTGDIYTQWLKCDITIDDIVYNTNEQYMMWCKAIEFGDQETAKKIMETNEPKEQKELGRCVKNYDDARWSTVADIYVYKANYAKFYQHNDLKKRLLATGNKYISECGTYDTRWSNGLSIEDASRLPQSEWKGTNRLGKILMRVREDLRVEQLYFI